MVGNHGKEGVGREISFGGGGVGGPYVWNTLLTRSFTN